MSRRTFKIVLIKPSHYDDDGYVIQWRRSTIPSNSLASVYGLLADAPTAQVLGPDVDIEIEAYDECNTVIDVKAQRSARSAPPAAALSAWSACSRTSFRARSISRASSAPPDIPVVIGGFHVSGCISMLPELPPDLKEALDSASRCSPAKAKAAWRRCCATSTAAR